MALANPALNLVIKSGHLRVFGNLMRTLRMAWIEWFDQHSGVRDNINILNQPLTYHDAQGEQG